MSKLTISRKGFDFLGNKEERMYVKVQETNTCTTENGT